MLYTVDWVQDNIVIFLLDLCVHCIKLSNMHCMYAIKSRTEQFLEVLVLILIMRQELTEFACKQV